jgi:rhodanese-related sulfurtransferase
MFFFPRFLYPLLVLLGISCLHGHGLGIVQSDKETLFELKYSNPGPHPVRIEQVLSSCACITVLDHPREIAAGETIEIPCGYRSDRMGAIAVDIALHSTRDTAAGPFAVLHVDGVSIRPEWQVEPAGLDTESFKDSWLLDIRAAASYAKLHIQGAISAPAYTLPSREDLKSRRIVLYDEGHDPVELLALVATLRNRGFSQVYALTDGFAGWLRAGRKVQGRYSTRVPYASLDPWSFALAQEAGPWQVVQVGEASRSPAGFTNVLRVKDISEIAGKVPGSEAGAGLRWLVVSDDRNDYERLEITLPLEARRRLFYLRGGLNGWMEHVRVATAAAAGSGREQSLGTNTRVALPAPRIGGRGCGSCGK